MAGKPVALIFEDEDEWVGILREVLGKDFTIEKAKSLEEVHEILARNPGTIEIALVDIFINIPTKAKISGLDAMIILNKEGIPCIAATFFEEDGKKVRDALVVGEAKDVWFKSEDLFQLRKKINHVLEGKKSEPKLGKGLLIRPSFPTVEGTVDPGQVFVIMPFSEPWSEDVLMLIKAAGEESKLTIVRADDIFVPNNIINDIWQLLNKAGLVVADITVHNANVFYELGIAHTLGKEVVLIRSAEGQKPPFDISVWRHLDYQLSPIKAVEFQKTLSKIFKEYRSRNQIS